MAVPRLRRAAPNPERRMSLTAHLAELRRRLFAVAAGLSVGTAVGWWLTELVLWDALARPVELLADAQHAEIVFPTITSAFELRLQIALTAGIVISAPLWLYELFAFFVPGLTPRERRATLGFVLSAVPLFLAGAAAGWWVLPNIVAVMTGFAPDGAGSFLQAKDYVDFVLKLVVVGVAFVLPVFVVLLNFAGVVTAAGILGAWRLAILAIALFTAVATPAADVVSMLVLAAPMIALFFVAWFIAWVHDRRAGRLG